MLLSDEEYYGNLPKKHIGVGVLLFNEAHQLLIIQPNYKKGWSLPGGGVENNETPVSAAVREVSEEINLNLQNLNLICVEYTKQEGIKPETLQFMYNGGELDANLVSKIALNGNEHSNYKFVDISEAINLLNERQGYALPFCIEAIRDKNTVYIEF